MTYLNSPGVTPVARVALILSAAAVVLAAGALAVALLHHPVDSRFPLVCGQSFIDGRTGHTVPMYTPCSEHRPVVKS